VLCARGVRRARAYTSVMIAPQSRPARQADTWAELGHGIWGFGVGIWCCGLAYSRDGACDQFIDSSKGRGAGKTFNGDEYRTAAM
jgi:hypothetical protein